MFHRLVLLAALPSAPASALPFALDDAALEQVVTWLVSRGAGLRTQSREKHGVDWLAPHVAEFDLAAPLTREDVFALRESLAPRRIDVACVSFANPAARRKKLLLADMDSTMIEQECIDELAAAHGVGDQVRETTRRAMAGELDFEQALRARVSLLRDCSADVIEEVLAKRITLMPGGARLVATMRKHGAYSALVSGGFVQFTSVIAERLGFDEHHANRLVIANGKLTGEVESPILGKEAKLAQLERLCSRLGLVADEVAAIGDGANDVPMLCAASLGVALHGKPAVCAAAPHAIVFGDLTAVLYLQGFREADLAHV